MTTLLGLHRMTLDHVAHLLIRPSFQLDVAALVAAFEEGRRPLAPPSAAPVVALVVRPPRSEVRLRPARASKPRRSHEQALQEIIGCKALLLEIIRRTSYDWVLYRTSSKLGNKALAEAAYNWLFKEEPSNREGEERRRSGKHITSFLSICEALDLDANAVRRRVKKLTPKNVMSVGRPAEYRRRDAFPTSSGESNLAAPAIADCEFSDDALFDG